MARSSLHFTGSNLSPIQKQETFLNKKQAPHKLNLLLDWEGSLNGEIQRQWGRHPLMRPIPYSYSIIKNCERTTTHRTSPFIQERKGTALSLNLSSKGMLLVIEGAFEVNQVLKIGVPTPYDGLETPTLAEVRWTRTLPFSSPDRLSFVGIKFLV